MAIYYPDGDGGRRILDGGSTTTIINNTVQGALVFNGVISTETLLPNVQSKKGAVGDLWSLDFTNEEKNIYKGDLLIYDGEDWELLGTSPQRPFYTLPTANESIKGGVKIGEGLTMIGETLNVTIVGGSGYTLPTATESVKGGIKVGHSLLMNGEGNEVMNVALDTTSSTVEGFMWINDVAETQSSVYDDAINDIWSDSSTGDNTSYDSDWDDKLNDIFS